MATETFYTETAFRAALAADYYLPKDIDLVVNELIEARRHVAHEMPLLSETEMLTARLRLELIGLHRIRAVEATPYGHASYGRDYFSLATSERHGGQLCVTCPADWSDRIKALAPYLVAGPKHNLWVYKHLEAMTISIDAGHTGAAYDRLLAAEEAARQHASQ